MVTALLDGNIYDKLEKDADTRNLIAQLCDQGKLRIIATPIVEDELKLSPFGGIPKWFPVEVLAEGVFVLDYAHLDAARLGEGRVYSEHRGTSNKIPDGILADSADAFADLLVSEDNRCRNRLSALSNRCRGLTYAEFLAWLRIESRA